MNGAFAHLRGVHTLVMIRCAQPIITAATFLRLRGVRVPHTA